MLFPAVLMNFPNSKVCLIGEWSISVNTEIPEWSAYRSWLPLTKKTKYKTRLNLEISQGPVVESTISANPWSK